MVELAEGAARAQSPRMIGELVELTDHVAFLAVEPNAVVVAGQDGALLYLNARAGEMFGVDPAEVLGQSTARWWLDAEGQARFAQAVSTQGRVSDLEIGFRRTDGSVFWAVVSSFAALWAGQPARCSQFQDVTRARRAEARALENERKYRLLAEHADDVIWTIDARTGHYTFVSPSIERLRGLTVQEAMNERMEDSLTPESFERANKHVIDQLTLPASQVPQTTVEIYDQPCRDGSVKHVEIKVSVVRDDAGQVTMFVGVSRDATARVRSEAAQTRLLAELRRALDEVKTLSGLVPICAHCKSVRDDAGYWHAVERWVSEHSTAQFSHGICPACLAEHYPEDA